MEKLQNVCGDILVQTNSVFTYNVHMHTYYEMTLYEPFDGKISINGKDFEINTITAVLICPSDFHEIVIENVTAAKFIKIGFNIDVLYGETPYFSTLMPNIEKNEFLVCLFKEILSKEKDRKYIELLINSAVHIISHSGEKVFPVNISNGYKTAAAAAKIINEDYGSNITLNSTAKQLAVSPEYLSKTFKENLGINFSHYLSNMRLQNATRLILNTQKSLTEICFEVGYGNFSHFSRSFKKQYGLSPREYRNIK